MDLWKLFVLGGRPALAIAMPPLRPLLDCRLDSIVCAVRPARLTATANSSRALPVGRKFLLRLTVHDGTAGGIHL